MNPVRWKYLAVFFLSVSLIFLGASLTLPLVKTPQEVTYLGPVVPYFGGNTTVSGYYVPTVDQGSTVKIAVSNFVPNDVEISVFPTKEGTITPTSGPEFIQSLTANITISIPVRSTHAYGIYIISYNGTTYVLRIFATFSPYFWLGSYAFAGVVGSLSSGILLYYYTFNSRRWKLEQQAIEEATEKS